MRLKKKYLSKIWCTLPQKKTFDTNIELGTFAAGKKDSI